MDREPFSFAGEPTERAAGSADVSTLAAPAAGVETSVDPSLSISHNSTEGDSTPAEKLPEWNKLNGSQKRTAEALRRNVEWLANRWGLQNLLFVTLTFGDHVTSIKEAQRRFNSLASHVLKKHYRRVIAVIERMEGGGKAHGRLHFHCLCVVDGDVKTGCDFEAIARGDYRSANAHLRSEWAFWRKTAPLYRFGRTESLPVKSTGEAIAKYVGSYISKHIGKREPADVGAKAIRYIGFGPCERPWNSQFMRAYDDDGKEVGSWLWRMKLKAYCALHNATMEEMNRVFGPRWAFNHQQEIMETAIEEPYPSLEMAQGDLAPVEKAARFAASLGVYKRAPAAEAQALRVWRECETQDFAKMPDFEPVDVVGIKNAEDRLNMFEFWQAYRRRHCGFSVPSRSWIECSIPSDDR